MRNRVEAVCVMLMLGLAGFGYAQSIRVSVIDAADVEHTVDWFDYGQDVRVDLADINETYQQFKFIRVMDTATPRGDISRVSLYCSDATTIPEVRILLGAMLDVGFPASFDTVIPCQAVATWACRGYPVAQTTRLWSKAPSHRRPRSYSLRRSAATSRGRCQRVRSSDCRSPTA